jgi:hypothetical protein
VHAANASWLGLANEQAMLEYVPRGQMDARSQFNCSGINMDCEIFAWGQTTTTVGDQGQRSNAALTAVQFANHWLYTRDVNWLQSHYLFPREVIAFFADYLTLEADGRYHSRNDCLNELCSGDLGDHAESMIRNDDPHVTIGLLRFLFPVVVEMAQTLGVDTDQLPIWRHIGANLAHYVDVAQPGSAHGARIYGRFRGALHPPRPNTQLTFSASWPGYDPELNLNATLRKLDDATALYMQSFTCGNCFPLFPPGAVRSGVAVDATWNSTLAAIQCGWQQNMLLRDGCEGLATEAIGGMAVVSEALLGQGQHGWLALFPGLPLAQPAAFRNLRAIGGLLVSARRAGGGGVVSNVVVRNDARDGAAQTVALLSPWAGANATIDAFAPHLVNSEPASFTHTDSPVSLAACQEMSKNCTQNRERLPRCVAVGCRRRLRRDSGEWRQAPGDRQTWCYHRGVPVQGRCRRDVPHRSIRLYQLRCLQSKLRTPHQKPADSIGVDHFETSRRHYKQYKTSSLCLLCLAILFVLPATY